MDKVMSRQGRSQPLFMHPAICIPPFVLVGELFALQTWINLTHWGYHIGAILFAAWGVQYLIWGIMCWLMWRFLPHLITKANLGQILTRILPLSFAFPVVEELIFAYVFPNLPLDRPHMTYWKRFELQLQAEFIDSMVLFWCAFFLFRGINYYQRFREKEKATAQLEVQLANAKLAALRMQLNPHFLFNAMNSISSLMRTDVNAADTMLEQLSSLLRISLERGNVQLIPLHEEMEFIEVYLSMQDQRYAGRVRRDISIDSDLYDALVPAMFLQPVVENAYAHGLSKIERDGELLIEAHRNKDRVNLSITNSGPGMASSNGHSTNGHGVGLSNVRSRLRLHYGEDCSFELTQIDRTHVRVSIGFPFQLSHEAEVSITRYGAE
ncbi:MAG TPA: histidine kinase [Terracidiphilus sp.]|jgi:signal transduction histidine kinase